MNMLSPHDLLQCVRRLPAAVRDLLKSRSDLMVAGGYIRACIAGESVSDVDIMCPSKDAGAASALALSKACSDAKIHTTENALTVKVRPIPVQFITRWTFSTPEAALASFDFTIACAAIWWDGQRWCSTTHPDFYCDLAAHRLIYCHPVRIEEAGGSMLRVLKFYQRGYRIPLPDLAAVIARLTKAVDWEACARHSDGLEAQSAHVMTGLLREVDPNIDPDHISHLPALPKAGEALEDVGEQ